MKPVPFKQAQIIIAEHQKEYLPVPAYQCKNPEHEMICFIEVTEEEAEQIKTQGGFYYSVWRFGTKESQGKQPNPLQPFKFMVESPFVDRLAFEDKTEAYLREIVKVGTEIGHKDISLDHNIMLIIEVGEKGFKYMRNSDKGYIETTFKAFEMMVMSAEDPLNFWYTPKRD